MSRMKTVWGNTPRPGRLERWLYRRRIGPCTECRPCMGTGWFGLFSNRNVCHFCGGHGVVEAE